MTHRALQRFGVLAGVVLAAGLPAPAAALSADARPGLPPVVELSSEPPASASREALADLLQQLETLQTELRNLRGQMEVQANEIERLKARQRELLADIDRRVRDLESRAASPAPPAGEAAAPVASVPTAQEQQDYDAALALLKQRRYEPAAKAFRSFIAKYPQSGLRDNAQYWLGETYYVMPNFRQALEEFTKVLNDNPRSPKAPDALLKVGYCYYELGEWAKARENLNQVITRYPGTTAARSAGERLAKMKKEGR